MVVARFILRHLADVSSQALIPVIAHKVISDSIIYSDSWCSYDGLVDLGFDKHLGRIMARMSLPMVSYTNVTQYKPSCIG